MRLSSSLLILLSLFISLFLISCTAEFTGYPVIEAQPVIIHETNLPPEVYFCPRDNCSKEMTSILKNAESYVHCALFDLDIPELIELFANLNKNIDVKLVIDKDNQLEEDYDFIRYDNNNQLTHNKFCVIDDKIVTTGSFNPTINGDTRNNNNFLILHSTYLAKNYETEFQELWSGIYGKGTPVLYPEIYLNNKKINNYFCPDDHCEEHVLEVLNNAKDSIYFMTFSFTSDPIGDLVIKKHGLGLDIRGVFEKTQNNQYNEYHKMNETMNIIWDTKNDKGKMHHKVFIIDEEIVITGSYNPTASGDGKNDENIVIIHDTDIASEYLNEFNYIFD